jgi:ferredoxin
VIKITYKRKDCIGCGNCLDTAPEYWKMNGQDGLASLVGSEQNNDIYVLVIDDYAEKENLMAADACPINIIRIQKQKY